MQEFVAHDRTAGVTNRIANQSPYLVCREEIGVNMHATDVHFIYPK